MATVLHLAVQYASSADAPPRGRIRRLVVAALRACVAAGRPITAAALTIRFVDRDEGRSLNCAFRGQDHATNVLTFPYPATSGSVEADLVICLPVVIAEAREQEKSVADHGAHLIVHGVLHACGHDHEVDAEATEMEGMERGVLAHFRIADPYRSDG